MSIDKIHELVQNAPLITKEPPQPLRRQKLPVTEFPTDSLPQVLKDAVFALNDKIQAPISLCAQSVLAVANLAVQGHANVMLPFGQERPISCFFLTIAESGERKSSSDNEILSAIKKYETKLNEQHRIDKERYNNDYAAWEKKRSQILKSNQKNQTREDIAKALSAIGEKPLEPLIPLLTCSDPTFEGLCKLMNTGHPSLGLFSSEGGQFLGGYGLREENKIHTAAALSNVWDGEPIKRIRKGDDITILEGRRLSMHLMTQPDIAAGFLSDHHLRDQGLLSRILVASPISAIGTRLSHEVKTESQQFLNTLSNKISDILNIPMPIKEGYLNLLMPRIINLSPAAVELYHTFSDEIERQLVDEGKFKSIKGFANKLPEHAARLAVTMALMGDIQIRTLEYEYLKKGIDLASYYANEALRLFDESMTDPKIVVAEKLLKWLHNDWDEDNISLPDIYQRGLNVMNSKAKAAPIVKILEEHGWLEKNDIKTIVKGKLRNASWKIIK